ncbi:hypothetical protein FB451DRAFT_1454268 [Mycena latifolia]|nr:hypothetical protein FB451DRAFT_1454268 [Mycena latifolia]
MQSSQMTQSRSTSRGRDESLPANWSDGLGGVKRQLTDRNTLIEGEEANKSWGEGQEPERKGQDARSNDPTPSRRARREMLQALGGSCGHTPLGPGIPEFTGKQFSVLHVIWVFLGVPVDCELNQTGCGSLMQHEPPRELRGGWRKVVKEHRSTEDDGKAVPGRRKVRRDSTPREGMGRVQFSLAVKEDLRSRKEANVARLRRLQRERTRCRRRRGLRIARAPGFAIREYALPARKLKREPKADQMHGSSGQGTDNANKEEYGKNCTSMGQIGLCSERQVTALLAPDPERLGGWRRVQIESEEVDATAGAFLQARRPRRRASEVFGGAFRASLGERAAARQLVLVRLFSPRLGSAHVRTPGNGRFHGLAPSALSVHGRPPRVPELSMCSPPGLTTSVLLALRRAHAPSCTRTARSAILSHPSLHVMVIIPHHGGYSDSSFLPSTRSVLPPDSAFHPTPSVLSDARRSCARTRFLVSPHHGGPLFVFGALASPI